MDIQNILFTIARCAPGFLLAITVHEYAHGRVAKMFGDTTAEREGRLSLNPAVHIDPMGTIVWPLVSVFMGWMAFGWAKPVPVSTSNFSRAHFKKALFWVSFAGPLSNFILGTLSALVMAIVYIYVPQDLSFQGHFLSMLQYSIFINFILGAFNLIPIPPLDGSRMVAVFLKGEALRKYEEFARFTPMIFIGIIILSMNVVHTIGYVLEPFVSVGRVLPALFVSLLQ